METEKHLHGVNVGSVEGPSVHSVSDNFSDRDLDEAYKYLENVGVPVNGDDIDLKALRRKIDWHIIPIAFACYTMQFIDKVLLNVIRSPIK